MASHDNWGTPRDFFDVINEEFAFDLDAAASATDTLCEKWITAEQDALITEWGHPDVQDVYCNPPYTLIGPFVQRAYEQSQKHHITTVVLLPAYTDPKYWANYVMKAHEIRFLKGRLKFVNHGDSGGNMSARFPSVLVIFKWLAGTSFGYAPHSFVWDWKA